MFGNSFSSLLLSLRTSELDSSTSGSCSAKLWRIKARRPLQKRPIHRKVDMVEPRRLRVLFGNLGNLASLAKLAKLADNLSVSGKRRPKLRRRLERFVRHDRKSGP